jgi:dCTP diphosphatase
MGRILAGWLLLILWSFGAVQEIKAIEREGKMIDKVRPRIGVGVLVADAINRTLLLGKRSGSHGEGEWAPPGGHLEFGESVEQCAVRELYDKWEGEPQVLEPHKCDGWDWFPADRLPEPLFPSVQSVFADGSLELFPEPEGELECLRAALLKFYQARDWEQFHSPKNVVMDLAAEVGELIEPFRYLTEEQSYHLSEKTVDEVKDEIGDVFKCIVYLAYKLGIDPVEATHQKLAKMELKYPSAQCKGRAHKYTAYQTAGDCN